jgi:3',5'-nucleoside bisphosphate phosphatase
MPTSTFNYDYHFHSLFSDGRLTPTELVERALDYDLQSLSLTDHDTFAGWPEFSKACSDHNIEAIPGIEFSVKWRGTTIHIAAYHFDWQSEAFESLMQEFKTLRLKRAEQIDERLQKKGLPPTLEKALEKAGVGQIGRPHFAQVLVDMGICKDMKQTFKKYLGAGKAGDVKAHWPDLDDLLPRLHAMGGLTMIAHPHRYNMTRSKLSALMEDFFEVGGCGLEVASPGMHPDMRLWLLEQCKERQCMITGGSDFHFIGQWSELGRFPPLPATLKPLVLNEY